MKQSPVRQYLAENCTGKLKNAFMIDTANDKLASNSFLEATDSKKQTLRKDSNLDKPAKSHFHKMPGTWLDSQMESPRQMLPQSCALVLF